MTNNSALSVQAAGHQHPEGIKITDEQAKTFESAAGPRHGFHGEWIISARQIPHARCQQHDTPGVTGLIIGASPRLLSVHDLLNDDRLSRLSRPKLANVGYDKPRPALCRHEVADKPASRGEYMGARPVR